MRIITWNINGYRSAEKTNSLKNLIHSENPDIICLQEIKMDEEFKDNYGYHSYYHFANKKGYSGVAILTKEKPIEIQLSLGLECFDEEGRFLLLKFKNFMVINIYIPHGGRKKENHPYKFASINKLLNFVKK